MGPDEPWGYLRRVRRNGSFYHADSRTPSTPSLASATCASRRVEWLLGLGIHGSKLLAHVPVRDSRFDVGVAIDAEARPFVKGDHVFLRGELGTADAFLSGALERGVEESPADTESTLCRHHRHASDLHGRSADGRH